MRRGVVLVLIGVFVLGGVLCSKDFQTDELAAREAQKRLGQGFRELWMEISYQEKRIDERIYERGEERRR